MTVVCESEKWPRALQRASVNSFGYGGANGHVILESINSYLDGSFSPANRTPANGTLANGTHANGTMINGTAVNGHGQRKPQVWVLPFSASSPKSLEARRKQVTQLVEESDAEGLKDLAPALAVRQTKLRLRDFILATANPKPTLIESLDADRVAPSSQPLPLAFVFTGQGAQYANMAKELMDQDETFLTSIRELDEVLQSLPSKHAPKWTLEQTILDEPATSKVTDVTRSQPLCTAVQIALVDMLDSWRVSPTAVIGHSSGEIAASYGAGLLTAGQAILAAYFRGFAVGQLKSRGLMMAAGVTPDVGRALIEELSLKSVRVACVNAPDSVTFSGSAKEIDALETELKKQGKFARKLETGGRAYHSHMMLEVGDLYEELVSPHFRGGSLEAVKAQMFSTVGHSAEELGLVDNNTDMASYFRQNLEKPVTVQRRLDQLAEGPQVPLDGNWSTLCPQGSCPADSKRPQAE